MRAFFAGAACSMVLAMAGAFVGGASALADEVGKIYSIAITGVG